MLGLGLYSMYPQNQKTHLFAETPKRWIDLSLSLLMPID